MVFVHCKSSNVTYYMETINLNIINIGWIYSGVLTSCMDVAPWVGSAFIYLGG